MAPQQLCDKGICSEDEAGYGEYLVQISPSPLNDEIATLRAGFRKLFRGYKLLHSSRQLLMQPGLVAC